MGATRYAMDPLTQALCLRWAYDDEEEVHLWHRDHPWIAKSPRPDELIERIKSGELFEAHNAKFEFLIWNNVLTREFPEFDVKLQMEQMRCSAAKASCLSLRRKLGDAANDIGLSERKDTDGQRLINKLSKPMAKRRTSKSAVTGALKTVWRDELFASWKPNKIFPLSNATLLAQDIAQNYAIPPKEIDASVRNGLQRMRDDGYLKFYPNGVPGEYQWTDQDPPLRDTHDTIEAEIAQTTPVVVWCEEEIEHRRNWEYCAQDVRTERALSKWCDEQTAPNPCMTDRELDFWFMDFRMNMRGVKLDTEAAESAINLCSLEVKRLDAEMKELTGGRVLGGSKRIAFRAWANEKLKEINAEPIPDTRADTLSFRLYGVPTKAAEEAKLARADEMAAEWAALGPKAEPIKRAFEISLEVNRSSVAKFRQMMGSVCPDGRLHDIMLYNGADRTGRWPLSGDHEVLTPEGWVRLDAWDDRAHIAQWRHTPGTAGMIEFGPAERIVSPYHGEMVRMKGAGAELFCTAGHKIPQVNERGGLRDVAADEVERTSYWSIPMGGAFQRATWIEADITRAVVMFQADGCIKIPALGKGRIKYVLGFTKTRKIERCRAFLTRLHIPFVEYHERQGNFATRFSIDIDDAPAWLRNAKKFGPWLLSHDPAVFVDELKHWDGCTDKRNTNPGTSYSTCSKNNAEWVQTMAALAGTRANIADRGIRHRNWKRSYRVHVHSRGARLGLKSGWVFSREPSPGKVYCARTQTGYFLVRYNGTIQVTGNSGQGVQPHNFVRGYQKEMGERVLADKDFPELGEKPSVWENIMEGDLELITLVEGPALPTLAKACRGALIPSEGYELYAADFKAIEARKLAWMASCATQLALFRSGGDPYLAMACAIYSREITKKDKTERQLGKKAVLGLGYAMGWEKFQATVWNEEGIWLDDAFCKKVVNIYRKVQCPEMPVLWKAIENAAISATQNPGKEFWAGGDKSVTTVTLNESDLEKAREIAVTQVDRRYALGRTSDHGTGDSGRSRERRIEDGIIGNCGEIAVAKYLRKPWTAEENGIAISFGDVDHDIEVRASSHAAAHLLVYGSDPDDKEYILTVGTYPNFRIVGRTRAGDVKRQEWWRDAGVESACYWVPQTALEPFTDVRGDGAVTYFTNNRFLHCRLPSGRLLAYLDPEVHTKINYRFFAKNERGTNCLVTFPAKMGVPMNRVLRHAEQLAERQRKILSGEPPESFTSPHLSFMGRHIVTKEWKRLGTHGGSLTENADQASSRDLLAEAMWRVDQDERFDLLLSIHDEVIAEAPIGTMPVSEFEAMVSQVPTWAASMPVEAEGWRGPRLRK